MIEGFKIRMTSAELKGHCIRRSHYHAQRADELDKELPTLRETIQKLKAQGLNPPTISYMQKSGTYDNDAVEDLESKIRDHRNKTLVFKFYSEHLFDEDYTLDDNALTRLEVLRY